MPWLTTEGASHHLIDGETIVGSGARASWRLAAKDLAGQHFIVHQTGDKASVRSAGVECVVALNGKQIGGSACDLRDGDIIDAGNARFVFSTGPAQSAIPRLPEPEVAHLIEARSGVAHSLSGQSVGIGRDAANAVVVQDPTASRFHAEVRREAGGYVLHPRGSSGTAVNGRRIGTPVRLEDGDRIQIANVELRFVPGPAPAGTSIEAPRHDVERSRRRTLDPSTAMEVPRVRSSASNVLIWVIVAIAVAVSIYLAIRPSLH